MAEDYEVGYGKPPQHSRFEKGHSGHPEGGHAHRPTSASELFALLAARTTIKVNGAVQRVRTARAICLALIQKALGGDVRAFSKMVESSARQWPTSSKLRRARHPPTSTFCAVPWIARVTNARLAPSRNSRTPCQGSKS